MHAGARRLAIGLLGAAGIATLVVATSAADPTVRFSNVATANTKSPGYDPPNILSPQLQEVEWARGAMAVENPGSGIKAYGYDDDGSPFVPVIAAGTNGGNLTVSGGRHPEAQKTEPDKNTYLVLKGQHGADPAYNYGTHFLFQGHEAGSPGYITRINLDADGKHRVTLLATQDVNGSKLPTIDGSTWDPWAQQLLFTSEAGPSGGVSQGGVWQSTLGGKVVNLQRSIGRAGMEGIQNDDQGNLYIEEDVGGGSPFAAPDNRARVPNSFVFRVIPNDAGDLTKGGKIQALQVLDQNGNPITQTVANSGVAPAPYVQLHTYGTKLKTKWITIVANSGTAATDPDDAALARVAGATPFKRPENGLFQPGSKFKDYYFDETGDTNADITAADASVGGFGSLFHLTQSPTSDNGAIELFYLGDATHAAFDNVAFFGGTQLAAVEDRGDTLHGQTALDSAWLYDTTANYARPTNQPIRFIAEGRDPSATLDSAISGVYGTLFPAPPPNPPGFYNDGDNEITGIHVSDGDPTKDGVLGAKLPKPFQGNGRWRAFWTQQHGDNVTYELIARSNDD